MARSLTITLVLAGVLASMGASYYRAQTTNFVVEAPTPQIAQEVARYAEHYRKEKAKEWLGKEMPPWPEPCPLRVDVRMDGAGGATTFEYGNAEVAHQQMHIYGAYERLLASVLPHEITHTVFAHYYRCPIPRWADEGGSVLSEDDIERNRHDGLARQILNTPGRAIPLRRLFALRDYPGDVMALYAEGYSVTNFLVSTGGRQNFLYFVAYGTRSNNWDAAAQAYYRFKNVEELERAWVASLRAPRRPPAQLAANGGPAEAEPTRRVLRQTAPPVVAALDEPREVYRGQAPADGDADAWTPRPARPAAPGPVVLGMPQPVPPPPAVLGPPVPMGASPVGYPR
jgi:hypothetical protein